jgi:hypothetical protein
MSHQVYANMWQIAAKAGMNKSIGRFPDVCLSPPSPPAGPIPVPYPDSAFSSDLKEGSKSVRLSRKSAALAQKSYYKSSPLGNEAATRSFGANVVTHQITGKTYFQAWSMDVKIEGKNVCRHIDLTTSNHGSAPPGSPPAPSAEAQTLCDAQQAVEEGKCPCCGQSLHPWQKDSSGKAFTPMKESDFWQKKIDQVPNPKKRANFQGVFDQMKSAKAQSRANAAAGGVSCPNVHPDEEKGCAVYFDVPKDAKTTYTSPRTGQSRLESPAKNAKATFEDGDKAAAIKAWNAASPGKDLKGDKLNHKTPSMAGGCNNPHNVTPESAMPGKQCKDIEAWQSKLENIHTFM